MRPVVGQPGAVTWTTTTLRDALRADLVVALRARDRTVATALRTTIAAIDNAEALPTDDVAPPTSGPVAGAVAGLGATEAVRRELSPNDLAVLLTTQVAERRAAADEVERHGRDADAARLRREADVVAAYRDRA
ncbi:uncharacterized protein YqeY [Nocardioides zeae]|uniref:Uncharacterized protein YqeY n=1 Tax=Nocardioides zeae TaxID=1457234 RepID=A0ACC6IIS4_9ACTN|nr:uncharacterized protein YqeY [Nocardioides zeae]MDR6210596.1 uncharacterized protein YqeY [Nocardioides zeae]